MNKINLSVLLLPASILIFCSAAIYSNFSTDWSIWITIYFISMAALSLFTARQSLFIQITLVWGVEDLEADGKKELARQVVIDFMFNFLIHSSIFSLLYWLIYFVWKEVNV